MRLRNIPEKITLASSLESLLEEGVINEIYGRLKSGKEAEVFAVSYGESVVAAKVYKDRAQRNFKNNAAYLEGRSVRNSRSQRAMDRGTRFGQEAAEEAWKVAEANALYKLHAAGVRVPTPVMFLDGVLLMELVRGSDGEPAPRLIDSELTREEAHAAYLDMVSQLVKMLCCDLIHGDLSPYNVLWATTGVTLIDFPQTMAAAQNSRAESFFQRDARNILGHFAAIEPSLRGRLNGDAREIWRAYVRRELTPDFMPSGRSQQFEERAPATEQREPREQREQRRPENGQPRQDRDAHGRRPNPRGPNQRGPNGPGSSAAGPHPQAGPERGPQARGPHHNGSQNRGQGGQARGPRLQMASPAQNIASQRGDYEPSEPRNQQEPKRAPQRDSRGGPEQARGPRGGQAQQRGPRGGNEQPRGPRAGNEQQRGPRGGSDQQRGPRTDQRSQPRPQRAQQQRQAQRRAPEVIVIKRRAPEPAQPAEVVERAPEPARRNRR